jgi:hypothetical protein
MFPPGERARDHNLAKEAAGFTGGVLGDPILRERADGNTQGDAGTRSVYAAGSGENAYVSPRGREALESAGFGVETIETLGRGRHFAAKSENFTHLKSRQVR